MHQPIAILISGGLDSAILLGETVRKQQIVFPLYIRCGLHYESVELEYLRRFLQALEDSKTSEVSTDFGSLMPLHILEMPVADLYGDHWSITGKNVPMTGTPDEACFLPGRNVLFLAKAMPWCHLHGVGSVALGSLQTNPFPDATPEFFSGFQNLVNRAVGSSVEICLPFAGLKKTEVMRRGRGLPLEHTFSCIQPINGVHCGVCNKCGERREAFISAGMVDPTIYVKMD
jgi:7-cyano-7-deazaguanine synthase